MQILIWSMLSYRVLKLSYFKTFFVHFGVLFGWLPISYCLGHWSFSLYCLVWFWLFLLLCWLLFLFVIFKFYYYVDYYFIMLYIFQPCHCVLQLCEFRLKLSSASHLLLKFSMCLFIFIPSSLTLFVIITLISFSSTLCMCQLLCHDLLFATPWAVVSPSGSSVYWIL